MLRALQVICLIVTVISMLGFIAEGKVPSKVVYLAGAVLFMCLTLYITIVHI